MNSVATLLPIIFGTLALCLGAFGNFGCRLVEFPNIGAAIEAPRIIEAGIFGYQTIGYLGTDAEGTLWVTEVCRSYTDIEDVWRYSYDVDRKMDAIQIIAIVIVAVGGIMLIGSCVTLCAPCHPILWKLYGLTFLVMSILQGVTLLVLKSSVCLDNPVLQYLEARNPTRREIYPDECEWGMGFRMSITATVFWFVAGAVALAIPAPQKESLGPSGLPPSEELALEEKSKADDANPEEAKPEEVNPEEAKEVNAAKPDEAVTEE
jgi:hypothetical protein